MSEVRRNLRSYDAFNRTLYEEERDLMSIRDQLKQREETRNTPKGNGINEGLPEGVTRYVRLSGNKSELGEGRQFVVLADPDNWFFYFCHEDGDYATRATYVKKHSCLHSPRGLGAELKAFTKPNGGACISCKAKAKRKLYFMIPVFDLEYKTWRVLDIKEFHAMNIIGDYDKLEKAAKKFSKDYTVVGDIVNITKHPMVNRIRLVVVTQRFRQKQRSLSDLISLMLSSLTSAMRTILSNCCVKPILHTSISLYLRLLLRAALPRRQRLLRPILMHLSISPKRNFRFDRGGSVSRTSASISVR